MSHDAATYALDATLLSLRVSLVATLLMVPPALALGLLLARRRFWGKPLVQTLVSLPLVVPPVAVGVILLLLLGRNGPLGGPLYRWFGVDVVFTWWAAALAAAVMSFPLLVRSAEAAFAEVPRRLEDVARTLGASPASVFFRVTLPLARRGVLYGIVLGFGRGLGEFGATVMIAGNIPGRTTTLAVGIFGLYEEGRDADALVLVSISAALAFVAILSAERWLRGPR